MENDTHQHLPPPIPRTSSWQKKTLHNFSEELLQQIFCSQFLAMVGVERLRCHAWHLRAPSQRDCCQQESSHSQSFLFVSASTFLLFVVVVASPSFVWFPSSSFPISPLRCSPCESPHFTPMLLSLRLLCLPSCPLCDTAWLLLPVLLTKSVFFYLNSVSTTPSQTSPCAFCHSGIKPPTLQCSSLFTANNLVLHQITGMRKKSCNPALLSTHCNNDISINEFL